MDHGRLIASTQYPAGQLMETTMPDRVAGRKTPSQENTFLDDRKMLADTDIFEHWESYLNI